MYCEVKAFSSTYANNRRDQERRKNKKKRKKTHERGREVSVRRKQHLQCHTRNARTEKSHTVHSFGSQGEEEWQMLQAKHRVKVNGAKREKKSDYN